MCSLIIWLSCCLIKHPKLFRFRIYPKSKRYLHVSEKQYTVLKEFVILRGTEKLKLQNIIL